MKKWNTVASLATEITRLDVLPVESKKHEINIAQANKAASTFINYYKKNGGNPKKHVRMIMNECQQIKNKHGQEMFTSNQLERLYHIFRNMCKNGWWPFSRIRINLRNTING